MKPTDQDKELFFRILELPFRFCYDEELWRDIRETDFYSTKLGKLEVDATKLAAEDAKTLIHEPVSILIPGPGRGFEAIEVVSIVNPQVISIVDLVEDCLEQTETRLKEAGFQGTINTIVGNFEDPSILYEARMPLIHPRNPIVTAILGNGVVYSNPNFRKTLHTSMQPNDYLMLAHEGYHQPTDDMLVSYDTQEMWALIANGLRKFGIKLSDGNQTVRFNNQTRSKEMVLYHDLGKILCLRSEALTQNQLYTQVCNDGYTITSHRFTNDAHSILAQK